MFSAANVMLNLTDTFIRKQENGHEATRANVAFWGFASLSALNIVLILILGEALFISACHSVHSAFWARPDLHTYHHIAS